MSFRPNQPYNDLPGLPPETELETTAVLKACVEARAALAELKQLGEAIPNQAMLINTIPLLEAQASSEIENIVTTSDALFRFSREGSERADPATREALRYGTALYEGFQSLQQRPLGTRTTVDVCRRIRALDTDVRSLPGTALSNPATGEIIYTPPEGQALLREMLANWERFLHEATDLDPLVRMAVGHYQFEAIHPFLDGNGRTGRILNLLFLVEQGLLKIPVLYLSGAITRNKADYYRLLAAVTRDAAWEEWILYMLEMTRTTAGWTAARIRAIQRLMDDTVEEVRERAPNIYSRELVEILFRQPYCRISDVVDAGIAKRQTASEYLKQLCAIGLLDELRVGRDKLFVHGRLLRLLTHDSSDLEPE